MSDDLRTELTRLVAAWRAEARASEGDEYSDRTDAYTDCADAVAALLAKANYREVNSDD